MNTKIKHYLALLVFTVLSMPIFAQVDVVKKPYYDYNRDWTFGIHGGFSWQQSDINDRFGGGLGLTLGKRFYGEPNSFWAVDWRGRLTYSNSFGQSSLLDTNATSIANLNNFLAATNADGVAEYTDGFLDNYRTDMVDIDLEAILTANRLRERTGVILQLFGGVGFDFYNSKIDQLDGLGNVYDYQSLNYTLKDRQIRRDAGELRNEFFRGGDYESGEGTKLTFMPSWGLGIGYQLRPWFSFGYEHRFAYPFTDELDTKQALNPGEDWTNDKHHLSYLYARFHFGANGDCTPPMIRVLSPTANPLSTQAPSINVEAEIEHLSSRREITVTVNGLPNYSFDYNTSSDKFNLPVLLEQGENTIRIEADNGCDEEFAIIKVVYNPNIVAGTPPSVVFTNPSTNRYTTTNSTYNVTAQLERVKSKTDISFSVNGQSTRNFDYNSRTGVVSANIDLREGQNTVEVSGKNKFGEDSKTTYIIYNREVVAEPVPIVNITRPSDNPHTTSSNSYRVEARIQNVSSKQDVSFRVNGVDRDFSYSNGRLSATINLVEGNNRVEVAGYNTAGSDQDETTIIYRRNVIDPPTINPPVVNITDPRNAQTTVNVDNDNIRATVRNVSSKNDITFTVNGKRVYNFSYNSSTDAFNADVSLIEGANTIRIEGRNSAGSDDDSRTIIYKKMAPVVRPPVVKVTSPSANPHNTTTDRQAIKATVNHAEKSQITFTVNGQPVTNFSFDNTTDVFTANITLREGANNFEIKAVNTAGNDKDGGTIIYKKPVTVQPPTVDITSPSPNALVYGTTQKIEADVTNVANKNQITFTVNGSRSTDFTYNASTNKFEGTAKNLVSGSNTVKIVASNSAGNDDDQVTFLVRIASTPPTVTIQRPSANPFNTSSERSTIIAKTTGVSNKSEVDVLLNGRSVPFTYNSGNGTVRADVTLREGSNSYTVKATTAGGTDQKGGTIIYKKTVPAPQITVTAPTRNPHETADKRQVITAKITNLTERSQVKFTMNGAEVNTFRFEPRSGAFSMTADLKVGSNRFMIEAENAGGKDAYKGEIIHKVTPTVQPPQVIVNSPNNNAMVNVDNTPVKATIKNVTSKSDVTYSVNGTNSSSFSFDTRTGAFSANAKLNSGTNTIVIKGKNSAGEDTETVKVIYRMGSGQKPVITVTNLSGSPHTTTDGKVGIEGKILYINAKNDASVKVNGVTTNDWTYDAMSDEYLIDYRWKVGTNNVVITATNAAGTTTRTQVIVFRQVSAPQVQFSSPTSNNGNTSVIRNVVDVRAIVQNADKRGIEFSVNGKRIPFNFSGTNLSSKVTLGEGKNTIKIVATNEGGTKTESITIDYSKPVIAPKVSFTKPSGSITVESNSYSVRASIQNINAKKDITVQVNDQPLSNFSFNASSGTLGFNANLKEGNNTIRILARNSAGFDNKSITIRYNKKPSVERPDDGNKGFSPRGVGNTNNTKPKVTKPKTTTSSPKPKVVQPTKPKTTNKPMPRQVEPKKPTQKKPVNKTTVKPTQKKPTPRKPSTKKPTEDNKNKKDGQ